MSLDIHGLMQSVIRESHTQVVSATGTLPTAVPFSVTPPTAVTTTATSPAVVNAGGPAHRCADCGDPAHHGHCRFYGNCLYSYGV